MSDTQTAIRRAAQGYPEPDNGGIPYTVPTRQEAPRPVRPSIEKLARIDDETILAEIPISEMFVAPYGRPISTSQIGRMVRSGFDPRKLGIITLSMRADGRFAILDGNHRKHLVQHSGYTVMLARVFIDLTYEEEADLFEALNTVKPPAAIDRFRARLEYKEPRALGINHLLGRYGLKVSTYTGRKAGSRTLTCVSVLDSVYDTRGPIEFDEIIGILYAAWQYDPMAYVGRMVDGLRHFWARYRDEVDRDRLVAQLQLTTPSRIQGKAGALASQLTETASTLIGKEVANLYNGRSSRHRLSAWTERASHPAGSTSEGKSRHVGNKVIENIQAPGD